MTIYSDMLASSDFLCWDLKSPLDFSPVNGGCAHSPRSPYTLANRRGAPESQVVTDAPHVGFFLLPESWISEEQMGPIKEIPR